MKPDTKAPRAAAALTPTTTRSRIQEDGGPPAGAASTLLDVNEVADWLRVEPRYVYRLASSGQLDRVYIGRYVRIPAVSVAAYIQAHTVKASERLARPRRPGPRARRLRALRDA